MQRTDSLTSRPIADVLVDVRHAGVTAGYAKNWSVYYYSY